MANRRFKKLTGSLLVFRSASLPAGLNHALSISALAPSKPNLVKSMPFSPKSILSALLTFAFATSASAASNPFSTQASPNPAEKEAIQAASQGESDLYSWFEFNSRQGLDRQIQQVKTIAAQSSLSQEDIAAFWNLNAAKTREDVPSDSKSKISKLLIYIRSNEGPLQIHAQLATFQVSGSKNDTWANALNLLRSHQVLKVSTNPDGISEITKNSVISLKHIKQTSPHYAQALAAVAKLAITAMMENSGEDAVPNSDLLRKMEAYKLASRFSPDVLKFFFLTYSFKSSLQNVYQAVEGPGSLLPMTWAIHVHGYTARCQDQEFTRQISQTEANSISMDGSCPGKNTTETHLRIDSIHSALNESSSATYALNISDLVYGGYSYKKENATSTLEATFEGHVTLPACSDITACSPLIKLSWKSSFENALSSISVTITSPNAASNGSSTSTLIRPEETLLVDRSHGSVEVTVRISRNDSHNGAAGWRGWQSQGFSLLAEGNSQLKAQENFRQADDDKLNCLIRAVQASIANHNEIEGLSDSLLTTSGKLDPELRFRTHYEKIFLANLLLSSGEVSMRPSDRGFLMSLENSLAVDLVKKYGATLEEQLNRRIQDLRSVKNHGFLNQALSTIVSEPVYTATSKNAAAEVISNSAAMDDSSMVPSLESRLDAVRALTTLRDDLDDLAARWKTEIDLLLFETSKFQVAK